MRIVAIASVVALLSIPVAAAGSDQEPPSPAPPQTQTAPAAPNAPEPPVAQPPSVAPPEAGRRPTDDEIQAAVEEVLGRDADIAGHAELRVKCEEGIVSLSGQVETLQVQRQAERRVGDVRGVLDIAINVTISSVGVPDSQVLMEIQRALDIPSFQGDNVAVAVAGGRVHLNGTTTTYAHKLLADRTVAEVPGVLEIQNNLRVTAPVEGDDAELSRRIKLLLSGGLTPVPGTFDVKVQRRQALLLGKVPLFSNRAQAERLALSVGGIVAVDNRLKVDPSLSGSRPTVEVTP